jgi:hypothetical protein
MSRRRLPFGLPVESSTHLHSSWSDPMSATGLPTTDRPNQRSIR